MSKITKALFLTATAATAALAAKVYMDNSKKICAEFEEDDEPISLRSADGDSLDAATNLQKQLRKLQKRWTKPLMM